MVAGHMYMYMQLQSENMTIVAILRWANRKEQADYLCVTVTDDQLMLKDQLKEYADRGRPLAGYNFLDYFINTYDTDDAGRKMITVNREGGCSHPHNERVAYKEGTGRDNCCQIICSQGHETLPNFIWQWFPWDNDSQLQELHAACMIALLKPWQTLGELKGCQESFIHVLCQFREDAAPSTLCIIKNLQHYQEYTIFLWVFRLHDGLVGRKQGSWHTEEEHDVDMEKASSKQPDFSEDDIHLAGLTIWDPRVVWYAEVAMNIAEDIGMFETVMVSSAFKPPAAVALVEDMGLYQMWERTLHTITIETAAEAALAEPDQ
jgi:hypothetical protein